MENVKRILLILLTLSIVGIAFYNLMIYYNDYSYLSNSNDINNSNVDTAKIASLSVSCVEEIDSIIPVFTEFDLSFDSDVNENYIKNVIKIEPQTEYSIEKINNKYYKLKTIEPLIEGQIYNIIQTTDEGTEKWAFQTERKFQITNYYPSGTCSPRSTVDIYFNTIPKENVSEYINITPAIGGEWNINGNMITFKHTKEFENNTQYTITVKKGAESKDNISVLEEDFNISFYVQDDNVSSVVINSEEAYKTNENINFELYVTDNVIDYENYSVKVLDLKNRENFINALRNEKINNSYNDENYEIVYSQNITKEISEVINETENQFSKTKVDFSINKEGYYIIIVKYGDLYRTECIQVNNYSATCNVLKNNDLLILVKGIENKNNVADVYINEQKIGTTDEDGLLFIEDYNKFGIELTKDFNYIEFKTPTPIILNTEEAIYQTDYFTENKYSQFNNGYLYSDRIIYDIGETIHFWGFAKNRVKEIKKAELIIRDDYNEIERVTLNLNEKDCFEYDYKLENINSGSYLFCTLAIDGVFESSRYLRILDYSTQNYDIQITSDKQQYINGETAIVTIEAQTYDRIKLRDLEFNYEITCKEMVDFKGSVKTDSDGIAKIEIPININTGDNYSKSCRIRILNSLIDGEQSDYYFEVHPYKNYVNAETRYILNTNTYKINLNEYNVLEKEIPGNSKVFIEANAYREEKYISRSYYDEYTKEMVNVYSTKETIMPEYNQSIEVEMQNGKGIIYIPNWGQDFEKEKYKFNIYIETEEGKRLFNQKTYLIYTYLNETDKNPYNYEEIYLKGYSLKVTSKQYNELKFGEKVDIILTDENSKEVTDYSNIELYTYMLSGNGVEIIKTKNKKLSFEYTEKMGNNISIYSIIYDGKNAYSIMNYYEPEEIYINKEEVKLTLEIKFDKEIYEPGEMATIKIKTLDHGKPISAGVNLSAVDTAFLDANGVSGANIVYALENYYFYYAQEIATKRVKNTGGGGGGGDGEPRSNLATTAFFENIITNENGEAEIKVQLPENITKWTITSQAISDNYKVAQSVQTINVSKEFYVDINHLDKYLENEKFEINVKSFLNLKETSQTTKYTLSIINEKEEVVEETSFEENVNDVITYKIENDLKIGQYKIKLVGECNGRIDSIIKKINIVDNLLTVTYKEEIIPMQNEKISIQSNKGALYISNKNVSKIINELLDLVILNNYRSDSKAISREVKRILNGLYSNELNFEKEDSLYISNALKLMENSNEDVELALRILSIGSAKNGYTNELMNRLEKIAGKEAFLWASVNAGRTVLKDLRNEKELIIQEIKEAENNISGNEKIILSRKIEDVLYIALGLADSGDYQNAKELYEILQNRIMIEDINNYELFTMLAIKLNMPDREELYQTYLSLERPPENEDFIKLYYIQNEISRNYSAGKLVLDLNGEKKEIEIENIGVTKIVIEAEDNVIVKEISDNISILLEDSKEVDFEKYLTNGYIISKEYTKNNSLGGNLYTVTIKLDAKKLYQNEKGFFYKLEDIIPNNMTFVSYDGDLNSYLEMKDGQKLVINCVNGYNLKNQSKDVIEVKYTVRKTNAGEQIESGTVLVSGNGEIIDILK